MLEPRSASATFKWRRTAFSRIDGAVDIAKDDWSLRIDGMSAAPVAPRSTAGRVMRMVARKCARLAK